MLDPVKAPNWPYQMPQWEREEKLETFWHSKNRLEWYLNAILPGSLLPVPGEPDAFAKTGYYVTTKILAPGKSVHRIWGRVHLEIQVSNAWKINRAYGWPRWQSSRKISQLQVNAGKAKVIATREKMEIWIGDPGGHPVEIIHIPSPEKMNFEEGYVQISVSEGLTTDPVTLTYHGEQG